MPNTQSAKKALRQSESRRIRNLSTKRAVKKAVKEYRQLVVSGKLDEANAKLPSVYKTLDKAAKVGVIKKHRASRLKSRLSRQYKKASNPASDTTSGAEDKA